MLVKEWNELPKFMQVEEVKPDYKVLRKKKGQLILIHFPFFYLHFHYSTDHRTEFFYKIKRSYCL